MGLEKVLVGTKMSPRNMEFLDELRRRFKLEHVDISQSSAMNAIVGIVRERFEQGDLKLFPETWQVVLKKGRGMKPKQK